MTRRRAGGAVLAFVLAVAAAGAALAGCTGRPSPDDSLLSVLHVVSGGLGAGGASDNVDSAVGRLAAEGHRTDTIEVDGTDPASSKAVLESAAGQWDVIVTGTSAVAEPLGEVAAAHPEQHFVAYEAVVGQPNVASLTYKQNEAGFLAGVLAGLATSDPGQFPRAAGAHDIAIVAGQETPVVEDFLIGFKAGARAVDPKVAVQTTFVGDFDDSRRAYNLARSLYTDNGADVVFHVAGRAGSGVLRAAAEAGRYAIASESNQNADRRGYVLASAVRHVGTGVYDLVKAVQEGAEPWGTTTARGVADGGVGLDFDGNDDIVPAAAKDVVTDYVRQIAEHRLFVPSVLN
ncbi:MAG: BMP family ABC transporter substrate-binding protein [Propionibacteriaceae bacterium]|jgi:basic membrane protein A|nr:BMP family ABC transporter substrate-binding protein [Propionibacteriaceae bacterium]